MSIEYISTHEQFNNRYQTFKFECKIKENLSIYHVGLDLEYICKQNFPESYEESVRWTINRNYNVSCCILQLASKNTCLLIDLTKLGPNLPEKLTDILTSGNWIKTGVNIDLDMKYLADNFNIKFCSGFIDVSTFASLTGETNPNLANLCNIKKNDKIRIRNWSLPLTVEMMEYCAMDGFCSHMLGEKIISNITNSLNVNIDVQNNKKDMQIKIGQTPSVNYINLLQEHAQKNKLNLPEYIFEQQDEQVFTVTCNFLNVSIKTTGNNKKAIKLQAAKFLYDELKIKN